MFDLEKEEVSTVVSMISKSLASSSSSSSWMQESKVLP
jgi:hypothetical protein